MKKQTSSGAVKTKKATGAVVDSAFYGKVREVFEQARQFVRATANFAMVKAYWLVGTMIVEKQGGEAKAACGDKRIFAAKYKLHLPSEQELIAELRRERAAIEDAQCLAKMDAAEISRASGRRSFSAANI